MIADLILLLGIPCIFLFIISFACLVVEKVRPELFQEEDEEEE